MDELKPCPFCGDRFPYVKTTDDDDLAVVICRKRFECAIGPIRHGEKRAVKAWNRRPATENPCL